MKVYVYQLYSYWMGGNLIVSAKSKAVANEMLKHYLKNDPGLEEDLKNIEGIISEAEVFSLEYPEIIYEWNGDY